MSSRVGLDSSGQSPSPTSTEELPHHNERDSLVASDSSRSSSSTVSSLMDLGWTEEDEHFTIERLQRTRKQLEDEIEV